MLRKRKEKSKKYILIIIILSILLCISLFFVFVFGKYYFDDINKPQYGLGGNSNSCQISPDLNKKVSYIFDRRKLVEFDKYGEEILDKIDATKYISYPVLVGEDESILELNDKIKLNIQNNIDEFYSNGNDLINDNCYVLVLDDNSEKYYCEYKSLKYEVYENNKYISILENEITYNKDIESVDLNNVYVIDKSKGVVLSNEEVIKSLDNISILKNNLIKYIRENYLELSVSQKWEIKMEDFIADLDILLSTNSFNIFFKDDDIYLHFYKVQGVEDVVFRYLSDKSFEEVSEMYE